MADRPVRQLRLLGRTRDGSALVMEAAGERFVLPVDDAVLAAMGAPIPVRDEVVKLSPRSIQERIRRGETSASIAVETGMDVAEVARFERPVIAERVHQADLAAATVIRGRPLLDRVLAHQHAGAAEGPRIVPEPPRLDAWLGEDEGDWVVQAVWTTGEVAHWHWRAASGAVVPMDAVARAISDEPARRDDLEAVLRPLRSRNESAAAEPSSGGGDGARASGTRTFGSHGSGASRPGPSDAGAEQPSGPQRTRRATVPSWEEITSGRPDPR